MTSTDVSQRSRNRSSVTGSTSAPMLPSTADKHTDFTYNPIMPVLLTVFLPLERPAKPASDCDALSYSAEFRLMRMS